LQYNHKGVAAACGQPDACVHLIVTDIMWQMLQKVVIARVEGAMDDFLASICVSGQLAGDAWDGVAWHVTKHVLFNKQWLKSFVWLLLLQLWVLPTCTTHAHVLMFSKPAGAPSQA
jgi:hypothetical protein